MATNTDGISIYFDPIEIERGKRALVRAKQLEKERLFRGWRYVKVNNRTQMLVPCNRDGTLSSKGKEMIKHMQSNE